MTTAANQPAKVTVLDRLLHILCRSLPSYLEEAKPWARGEHQPLEQALSHLAADQQEYARRLAQAIVQHGGRPEPGRFPIEFTAVNDTAIDFLVQQVIERQRRDLAAIEHCAAELTADEQLHSLVEEILGNARGHLEILEEVADEGRGARGEGLGIRD